MSEEEVRKIEIAYPQAFCRAARAGRPSPSRIEQGNAPTEPTVKILKRRAFEQGSLVALS